jgi:hypothetical protein
VRLRVTIDIQASPARIWDVIEPIESHIDWMSDAERIVFTTGRTRGVDTEFECLTKLGPIRLTDRMRVTEWEPRHSMGIEHRGVVRGRGRFTIRRTRRGSSRFTWSERLRFPWWMGGPIGALAAKPMLKRVWRANLSRLAAICES